MRAGYSPEVSLDSMTSSTFIGSGARSNADGITNSMALGADAVVTKSNQIVIGDEAVTETNLRGHIIASTSVPTVQSCGTGPSVQGSDVAGTISVGTGSVTACTIKFATSWNTSPACVFTAVSTTARTVSLSRQSSVAVSTTFSGSLGSGLLNYICLDSV